MWKLEDFYFRKVLSWVSDSSCNKSTVNMLENWAALYKKQSINKKWGSFLSGSTLHQSNPSTTHLTAGPEGCPRRWAPGGRWRRWRRRTQCLPAGRGALAAKRGGTGGEAVGGSRCRQTRRWRQRGWLFLPHRGSVKCSATVNVKWCCFRNNINLNQQRSLVHLQAIKEAIKVQKELPV